MNTIQTAKTDTKTNSDPVIFEIFETGDPYSKAWDCVQYANKAAHDSGIGYWGGTGLCGTYRKAMLVCKLRQQYPGCVIINRDTGRKVR